MTTGDCREQSIEIGNIVASLDESRCDKMHCTSCEAGTLPKRLHAETVEFKKTESRLNSIIIHEANTNKENSKNTSNATQGGRSQGMIVEAADSERDAKIDDAKTYNVRAKPTDVCLITSPALEEFRRTLEHVTWIF